MLTSLLGIRLILLVGETIPLPASYDVMSALTHVEVTNDVDQGDGFQMPGVFLIYHGEVLRSYRHQSVADRPHYTRFAAGDSIPELGMQS